MYVGGRDRRVVRFNPRAREGRDDSSIRYSRRETRFNPRAREGRDLPVSSRSSLTGGFNPRAREGRDTINQLREAFQIQFQSTRPRGARLLPPYLIVVDRIVSIHAPARGATLPVSTRSSPTGGFNPRAREGRDVFVQCFTTIAAGFNPRAREGRDPPHR